MQHDTANPTPFVSVIIPVLDDAMRLRKCLSALSRQTYPKDRFEIIVVDNGSAETLDSVQREFPHAVFALEEKQSSYAARNKGIALSRGEIIAFTDADCIPAPDWLACGAAALSAAPGCGLLGGRIEIFFAAAQHPSALELYEAFWAFPQETFLSYSKFGATANVFTWRRVLDDAGFFDDSLQSGGDHEWGNRVHAAGYKLVYSASTIVQHPARASFREIRLKLERVETGIVQVELKQGYPVRRFICDVLNYSAGTALKIIRLLRSGGPFSLWQKLKASAVLCVVAAYRVRCRILAYLRERKHMRRAPLRRLCFVTDHLETGGVQRALINLTAALAQTGQYDISILRIVPRGRLEKELDHSVRLVDLGASSVARSLPALLRRLREEAPDAVIAGKDYVNITVLAACLIAGLRSKRIVTVHTNVTADTRHQPAWRMRMVPALARVLYRFAHCTVCASYGVQSDVVTALHVPPEKTRVIYYPIVNGKLRELGAAQPHHPWFAGGTPIVLGCGRLREQKNFALLIKALASLREKVAAKLVILGEGPQRKNLESLISELGLTADVSLPGEVENPLSYMAHASVFCLSSSWEGFGIVLVEALAMGLPVISTDCPSGPAEILDGGRFGELVPVGDLPALSCALEAALTHKTFDKNALIERASLFSSEAACREYRRLFAAL